MLYSSHTHALKEQMKLGTVTCARASLLARLPCQEQPQPRRHKVTSEITTCCSPTNSLHAALKSSSKSTIVTPETIIRKRHGNYLSFSFPLVLVSQPFSSGHTKFPQTHLACPKRNESKI